MTARITSFAHDGLTFDVVDEGPLDGPVVVLLHGFPERATSWRGVTERLHRHGLRTLAVDQRGYSRGARPRRRRDYRLPLLVDDVVALLEQVGTPVHLVGHDWGAAVGWLLAARRPDLLLSWTAVSVPHPRAFVRAALTASQGRRSWYFGFFSLPRLPERAARPGGGLERGLRRSGMTDADIERFRTEIVADGALPGALGWYRATWLATGTAGKARVRVPTTLVWSDGDVAVARRGVELSGAYVDGPFRLAVLEGVSHWIPTHAPEPLAEAILDRTGRRTGQEEQA
jgi:pimeloyl-ACP methyl ester carboxylesterase